MPDTPAAIVPARVPPTRHLPALREAASGCTACDLYRNATQTVFGRGEAPAEVVLVGEQPGDQEDRRGEPFVGPAGRILAEALEAAGIEPTRAFVTNAVKHFKWRPQGKRRLHDRPDRNEIEICKPWLIAELEAVQPRMVVALGATAAWSVLGRRDPIGKLRGQVHARPSYGVVVTYHPSAILRAREARALRMADLVADLRVVREELGGRA